MENFSWKKFLHYAIIRALRTIGQSAGAYLTTCAMIQDISIPVLLGTAGLSGFLSICTSLVTGLPEVPEKPAYIEEEEQEDDGEEEIYGEG